MNHFIVMKFPNFDWDSEKIELSSELKKKEQELKERRSWGEYNAY